MAAFFVDLDGTFFWYGTNDPLPGAVRQIGSLLGSGHQVIFTTARNSVKDVKQVLKHMGFGSCMLLANVQSPRVVINDDGAIAINRDLNEPWSKSKELSFLPIMDLQDEAFVG